MVEPDGGCAGSWSACGGDCGEKVFRSTCASVLLCVNNQCSTVVNGTAVRCEAGEGACEAAGDGGAGLLALIIVSSRPFIPLFFACDFRVYSERLLVFPRCWRWLRRLSSA